MAAFLSDEWFDKVAELTTAAGDLEVPAALANVILNLIVTNTGNGDVQMALNAGKFEKGHDAAGSTTLTLPADLARRIFVESDVAAGMQGFMSGQIKVAGDMTKLMAMQSARPSAKQAALLKEIQAITA